MRYDYYEAIGEGLYSEKLENGLTVYVFPKKGYHKCFAHFAVKYGGSDMIFDLDGTRHVSPAGVAHFLEHKLFDTKNGNALTLLAQNGASPNAYTGNGMTAYHFTCTEKFFENLEILLRFVTDPYFTPESVAKEQGIIGQEIGMYDDEPGHVCYMNLMRTLYRENPVRTDIAGTVESISGITADTLYLCHNSFYTPGNMVLTVVGDVEAEKVLDYARRLTPAVSGPVPQSVYGTEREDKPSEVFVRRKMAVSIPQFYIGSRIHVPEGGAARQKCRVAANLFAQILCGESGPLYGQLYADGLINRSFGAGADFFPGGGVMLAAGESAEPEKVFAAYKTAAENCLKTGLDPVAFSRIKRAYTGAAIFGLNSFDDICYNQAADYFAGAAFLDRFAVLQGLEPADLMAFAEGNMDPANMALSVVEPL